jgi:hypothetical protein
MSAIAVPAKKPRTIPPMFSWARLRTVLIFALGLGLLFSFAWTSGLMSLLFRMTTLGLIALVMFGLFERWPRRLPRWIERWVLQVVSIAVTMPIATAIIFAISTQPGAPNFTQVESRMHGYGLVAGLSTFFAPWIALASLVRQKEALARNQELAFDLERSQLERQASDARLRLLQGQVAPHFLFNTLANIQALVDAGSPRASAVLQSLINYLRAAVPRLDDPATTLGQELELVQAYLELMHMRMPDRLQFTLHVDDEARDLVCPPMTLLTLVENAVRHGIDPGEEGGRIDIVVHKRGERCLVRVTDTGVGLRQSSSSLGTGLSTLRERLQLTFGGDAELRVSAQHPKGVSAELEFPARRAAS